MNIAYFDRFRGYDLTARAGYDPEERVTMTFTAPVAGDPSKIQLFTCPNTPRWYTALIAGGGEYYCRRYV